MLRGIYFCVEGSGYCSF